MRNRRGWRSVMRSGGLSRGYCGGICGGILDTRDSKKAFSFLKKRNKRLLSV
jgi:hypothetical protein